MAQTPDATKDKLVEDFNAVITDTEQLLKSLAASGGEKAGAIRASVEEHLEVCPGCVYYLEQLKTTIRLTGRLRPEDVSDDAAATLLAAFRDWNAKE